MVTVYNELNQVMYEGSYKECQNWILNQAETLSNGTRIFRTWEMEGFTFYDVGCVYHM